MTIIGFARDMVTVNEADGSAILTVRVLIGVLAPGATTLVEFTTANRPPSDTSAIGKPTTLYTHNVPQYTTLSLSSW